jgi:hypothetical protein
MQPRSGSLAVMSIRFSRNLWVPAAQRIVIRDLRATALMVGQRLEFLPTIWGMGSMS